MFVDDFVCFGNCFVKVGEIEDYDELCCFSCIMDDWVCKIMKLFVYNENVILNIVE